MGMLRTVGGWGLVLFGAIILLVGYTLTMSTPFNVGKTDTAAMGAQWEQIGFMIIVAGFGAWIIVSILRTYRII